MEDVSKGWAKLPSYVAAIEEERDTARAKLQRAYALLHRAEDFLTGFEDDEMQGDVVVNLLRDIRGEADVCVVFASPDQRDKVYSAWAAPNVEFDDPVRVSQTEGGFWALGWLWVYDANEED